ncbi:uncharacterized protein SPSK_00959 [Sporothrix schenckii 1099-18]|uniref:Uncharacterized protein n=1 Tax=Sporothrix schenckii 1099-18 TaxID=1397361 RepID=A0A0F2LY75_SPOSC|nr:uncharacterized protein SPSK_00959 [Sporothrix schenckii 1099-18]KJR81799.1 hypothetical protein SPSK_00959 [Sporothrix schenckii 1099-18]
MAHFVETRRLESLDKDRRIFQWLKEMPDLEKLDPYVLEPWQELSMEKPHDFAGKPELTDNMTGVGRKRKWVGTHAEKRK